MASDKDLATLKIWLQRFKQSDDYLVPSRKRGQDNYKLYKLYKDSSEKLYKHDLFVPYSFAFMEDLAAYFMLSVSASPNLYTLEPRWAGVSADMARALEVILNWAILDERTEFALECEELIKSLNLYNSAFLINYPEHMEVSSRDQDGNEITRDGAVVKMDAFDHIHLDSPHPFLVYPEPGPKRLSRAGWVIKRCFESLDHLESAGIYKNLEELRPADKTSENDPVQELLSLVGMATIPWNENKIELLDCFMDHDVVTIANRRVIIRDTREDPLRPYSFPLPMLDCRFAGAPGEFEGMGAMEVIKPLQKELNLLRSQRRENVSLILNKIFKYDMLAGEVDLSTLVSAPGNVILQQGDCVQEMPVTDVTASSYREEQSLIYDIQSVLSFWDYGRGATPRRKETATGIIRLQQAAQARNEWHLRKLDMYILQPLARRILTYIRESLPERDAVAIAGQEYTDAIAEFYQLDTNDLKRLIHIRPMTDSISSVREIDTNQFLQAFDRLIRLPNVNTGALIKVLLQKLGQKNIKEIISAVPSSAGQDATNAALKGAIAGAAGPATQAQVSGFLNTQTPPAYGAGVPVVGA